jgi:hypothetical protein
MMKAATLLLVLSAATCAASTEPLPPQPPIAPPPNPQAAASSASSSTTAIAPPPAPLTDSATASSGPLDPPPLEVAYPFKGVATIPDDCQEASVVLTTAPKKMGLDYDWTWTRQALYASPQFQIVEGPGKPAKPMQVRLDMYAIPEGYALVGVCHDGATCNKLAAMYRATVQTCDPQLHCGALPLQGASLRPALVPASGQWLPLEETNVVGRCARLGICMRVEHEPMHGNPSVVCQSAPSHFRTECAKKATCGEVVSCLR